jgi:hypothetical protein
MKSERCHVNKSMPLKYPEAVESTQFSHHILLKFVALSSSHLQLALPGITLLLGSLSVIVYAFIISVTLAVMLHFCPELV